MFISRRLVVFFLDAFTLRYGENTIDAHEKEHLAQGWHTVGTY